MAFLNGYLDETISMAQQDRFVVEGQEKKVFKLKRSLWNVQFDEIVNTYGLKHNLVEPCVYKLIQNGKLVFLVPYMDDIVFIRNNIEVLLVKKH